MSDALKDEAFALLEAKEFDGRLHFPDALQVKQAEGGLKEIPVLVRVPRFDERARCRVEARKWCTEVGVDAEKDVHLLEHFDTFCLLARAIRDAKNPKEQHATAKDLVATYEVKSLLAVWDRVNHFDRLLDPRVHELDEAQFWQLVEQIARRRNLGPLVAIAGDAQDSFVTRMAVLLSSSRKASSSSPSNETSTPGE